MNRHNEIEQVPNPPSLARRLSRQSLWLGVASIVLFALGRVLTYIMYSKSVPSIYRELANHVEAPVPFLSLICGLLAILMGRIAYRRNKELEGERKDKAAQIGIVLGILALIPACLFVCGMFLLGLAYR